MTAQAARGALPPGDARLTHAALQALAFHPTPEAWAALCRALAFLIHQTTPLADQAAALDQVQRRIGAELHLRQRLQAELQQLRGFHD